MLAHEGSEENRQMLWQVDCAHRSREAEAQVCLPDLCGHNLADLGVGQLGSGQRSAREWVLARHPARRKIRIGSSKRRFKDLLGHHSDQVQVLHAANSNQPAG